MSSSLTVSAPTVEHHPTGFGIDTACPRLSWRFLTPPDSIPEAWEQTAYDVEIVRKEESAEAESYHIASNESSLVPWPSTPLQSREQARVRVRAYDNSNPARPTDWSPWVIVECALLDKKEWKAVPITSQVKHLGANGSLRPVRFRRTFSLPTDTTATGRARLYITSLGVYRAFVNGKRVGDHCMAPGWTSYRHRLNYQVFDVASLLDPTGPNVLAVEVAEGWYATRLAFAGGKRCIYGDEVGVIAQLEVGSSFTLVSDASWSCQASAITSSEIYDGEVYDAREETVGWNESVIQSDGEDSHSQGWAPVRELAFPQARLIAPNAPPVRVTEEVSPVAIINTPSGKTVLDFGQNLVGRLLVRSLHKPHGHRVSFGHAEVLENGELGTRPLRDAKCRDEIIFADTPLENWSPQYTFHGFRYVQVDGWTPTDAENPLSLSSVCAQVLHSDLRRTGWFSCSHPMVNKLHENAWWSMRGNFLSVPTDCPQRDERLGWTGDIQVFAPSASFLYHTAGMLGDWLQDLSVEQLLDSKSKAIPPFVVPNVLDALQDVVQDLWPEFPQAVWDDVTVLTPWTLYRSYGDVDLLRRQYPSMQAWVDRGVARGDDGLWDPELWQLGDWLDPTAPPDEPGNARTNGTLVADAYLVHVTSVLAQISTLLGETDNATRYEADARRLKTTFQHKYIAPSGLLAGDTQTALSLAIMYELHANPEQTAAAAKRLALLVRLSKFRVSTGFAGTPIITHALSRTGNHQLAYRMLLEKNNPSWMYPIRMGATTIWERWDSMLPDGSVNPGEMTSFNHYALGSVIAWLHEYVAGISQLDPGWKTFRVAPIPGGTITSAQAAYETPYGRAETRWQIVDGDQFELHVSVPPNSTALVILPHEWEGTVMPDTGRWVGSGSHSFHSRWSNTLHWPPKTLWTPLGGEEALSIV
ncbi:hypothetical protein ASPZODRAFT_55063 [Penicilliopsis zonata CBS 506.65]|uniref:alpha-L-rhamnosidase n=1 Tax=Penicilliopsis zonata CBS 506.65 TaxID=1073090 RepID=A0A1L9STR8_9EURO|nr:hypothetical protein ASPZODRAFT_55063 [Penicilliopsis zonata CBS 506.65]OJJ50602.1 hypothetical protein ASPZODRAFT_55063 [Penicilliopsis zonata CBS 506.65]